MVYEGWYVDPFGHHEARWFSDGSPTALVRDGNAESDDAPPSLSFEGVLTRPDDPSSVNGEDLRRSDDVDNEPFDPAAGPRMAFDVFDQTGAGTVYHPKHGRKDDP
jgi:hypothetical protein